MKDQGNGDEDTGDEGTRDKLVRKAEELEPEEEVPFQEPLGRLSDRLDEVRERRQDANDDGEEP